MPNLIACRLSSYAGFQDRAWTHLPELGIHHIEIHIPAPAEQKAIAAKLKDHGLHASCMQAR